MPSVASVFISRWDSAADPVLPSALHGTLGLAMAQKTYASHLRLLSDQRWQALAEAGARPQRVLWASTSAKNPDLPDTYYLGRLAAPATINTVPEQTLLAFASILLDSWVCSIRTPARLRATDNSLRPARWYRVGLPRAKAIAVSERVALRQRWPWLVVTWLVTGFRGTGRTTLDARIWRGSWLAMSPDSPVLGTVHGRGPAWPGASVSAIVIRQASRWVDRLPGPRRAGACHKSRTRSVMSGSAGPCRGEWHPGCAPSSA